MLPDVVAAMSKNQRVNVSTLYQFEFLSRTMRFWDGVRKLTAGGNEWEGSGSVISVSGLGQSRNMAAQQVTFNMSGAQDDLIQFASGNQQEVANRPCVVFIQFMSDEFTPLDEPVAIWSGNMDTMSFSVGGDNQSIQLTAESVFVSRVRAQYAYMTDVDQQVRWPGDRGMEFMPTLRNKTVPWLRG